MEHLIYLNVSALSTVLLLFWLCSAWTAFTDHQFRLLYADVQVIHLSDKVRFVNKMLKILNVIHQNSGMFSIMDLIIPRIYQHSIRYVGNRLLEDSFRVFRLNNIGKNVALSHTSLDLDFWPYFSAVPMGFFLKWIYLVIG